MPAESAAANGRILTFSPLERSRSRDRGLSSRCSFALSSGTLVAVTKFRHGMNGFALRIQISRVRYLREVDVHVLR